MEYRIFTEHLLDSDSIRYQTYGITCGSETIHDISTNCEAVKHLAEQLTKLQVSLIHFREVVEDFVQGG